MEGTHLAAELKHGDFTNLAKFYNYRAGYSPHVLQSIAIWSERSNKLLDIADVGAGTGKLSTHLVDLKPASLVSVEPNDAMREEGKRHSAGLPIEWRSGSGEATGLDNESKDWILMGSSFHWVDASKGLPEFHRVLRKGGMFTCLWNPRDLESSPLQLKIDKAIKEIVPELNRVSSGASKTTKDWVNILPSTGHFNKVLFLEGRHEEVMDHERYMGIWHSVNDIQVQAGPDRWQKILNMIEDEIKGMESIVVPYVTRSWTAWKI